MRGRELTIVNLNGEDPEQSVKDARYVSQEPSSHSRLVSDGADHDLRTAWSRYILEAPALWPRYCRRNRCWSAPIHGAGLHLHGGRARHLGGGPLRRGDGVDGRAAARPAELSLRDPLQGGTL